MQVRNEARRRAILKAAETAFSRKPFHEVKLDAIASSARVGKGTIYVYFQNKEQLYIEMVLDGLDGLLEEVRRLADLCVQGDEPAWDTLRLCVRHVCDWMLRHPRLFDMMRSATPPAGAVEIRKRRTQLGKQLERILVCAADRGEISDPEPRLTAQFIPSMARAAVVWGSRELSAEVVATHLMRLLEHGVRKGDA